MKNIFLTLLLIASYCFSQNTIGTILNTEESYNGYTLYSPRSSKNSYLINNCGEIVKQWNSDFNTFGGDYLLEDGTFFSSHFDDKSTLVLAGNTGRIEKKDWDNNLLWGFSYGDTDFSFHHDYFPLPNGNVLIVVAHRMSNQEAIDQGRNPSTLSQSDLYDERIIEVQPIGTDSGQIVWEWRLWDHLIQDFDNSKPNFGVVGDHPELLNINYIGDSENVADWLHVNAMDYNEELDQIIISSRHLNEFYIIDHSTTTAEAASNTGGNSGKGGDFLYRWGNPESYNQGNFSDKKASGQHTVHWIPKGLPDENKIMFFNNGRDRTFSSVEIINPPVDVNGNYNYTPNTAYAPLDSEWIYVDQTNPDNFKANFISGAYRLANGNTLITNGPIGNVFEIDSNFNTVWEYTNPLSSSGPLSQGDNPFGVSTPIFRTKRYGTDYPAFTGRDLSPMGHIEQNPIPENCTLFDALSVESVNINKNFRIYPNPSFDILYIDSLNNQDHHVELFDLNGRHIHLKLTDNKINVSELNSGVYLLKVTIENRSIIKQIMKI